MVFNEENYSKSKVWNEVLINKMINIVNLKSYLYKAIIMKYL